ncbi:TcpQ domain-containing protein [Cognaticolwellia mytili]|uniref:TcpQ domain-containing protein n=1 Tax=Cognaticolwellia mytili TaxID=1888913 RepID=UPI000A1777D1|nr:TcpQ domain-containing protein [Cognaticolwellia mytili]
MNFWLRNIVLGTILIGLAAALLLNQDLLFSLTLETADNNNKTSSSIEDKHVVETVIDPSDKSVVRPSKSKNAAAEGLSRFYANLHGDSDEKGPKIIKNIVYLPEPKGNLEEILEARRLITRPLRKNWTGRTETHPFRLGETLFQKLSQYSEDNGLEVIWWLDRDFLVKDAFRVNKDILITAYQVGKAIEGHFENGLSIYFCNKQRTIVLIEYTIPYLINQCILLRRPGS